MLLGSFPGYAFVKGLAENMQQSEEIASSFVPVLVRFDDYWQVAFETDRMPGRHRRRLPAGRAESLVGQRGFRARGAGKEAASFRDGGAQDHSGAGQRLGDACRANSLAARRRRLDSSLICTVTNLVLTSSRRLAAPIRKGKSIMTRAVRIGAIVARSPGRDRARPAASGEREQLPSEAGIRTDRGLGRQVKVGNLSLSMLSGSVSADNISIADDPAFSKEPFVTAKSFQAGVEIMPLIFSRTLHVTGITLEEPQITLLRGAGGTWNFSSIGGSSATAGRAAGRCGGEIRRGIRQRPVGGQAECREGAVAGGHCQFRARSPSFTTR